MNTKRKDATKRFVLLMLVFSIGSGPSMVSARPHHHRRHTTHAAPLDLSPVSVEAFTLPYATDPHQANKLRRMHFENGVTVHGTRYIRNADVKNRDLFVLQITQSLEGGFDSVNMYDKGVLSWGIMQWASHVDSLHQCLWYTKQRLRSNRDLGLWNKLFVASGLDTDRGSIRVYGKPVLTADDARRTYRGTVKPAQFDPKLISHWAAVFARAGRQPAIQEAQIGFACHIVDRVMAQRIADLPYHAEGRSGLTVEDLTGNDPYAQALVFALWTNNPKNAWVYVADAARAARKSSVSDDPSLWPRGAFSYALLNRCRSSRFGNWQKRAQIIESREITMRTSEAARLTPFEQDYQVVLAHRKQREGIEIASRHMERKRKADNLKLARKVHRSAHPKPEIAALNQAPD